MSSPSSPKSLSPLRLTALTASSAVTTMKAAPDPGSASREDGEHHAHPAALADAAAKRSGRPASGRPGRRSASRSGSSPSASRLGGRVRLVGCV